MSLLCAASRTPQAPDSTLHRASHSGSPVCLPSSMVMDPQKQPMRQWRSPILGKRQTPSTAPPKEETPERPAGGQAKHRRQRKGNGGRPGHQRGRNPRYQNGAVGQAPKGGPKGQGQISKKARLLVHQQESISTLRLSTGWVWWPADADSHSDPRRRRRLGVRKW